MKEPLKLLIALIIIAFTTACQKELSPYSNQNNGTNGNNNDNSNNNSTGSRLVRILQGTGNSEWGDTVTHITYSENKISTVYDSAFDGEESDTLHITYNKDGKMVNASSIYGNTANFTYDDNGLLTRIKIDFMGYLEVYDLIYENGVLVKKECNISNVAGSNQTTPNGYYTYKFTNGNITSRKQYSSGGDFLSEQSYTYSDKENSFKDLSLLNIGNHYGLSAFSDYFSIGSDMYFNNNLMSAYSFGGVQYGSLTTTFNGQQLKKLLLNYSSDPTDPSAADVFTYQFFYQ